MIVSSYKYKVEMILILKNENIQFQNESIVAITIDSNYDLNNRPIIYASLKINPSTYDKLVLNRETGIINLRIKKISSNGGSSLNKDYIHDSFSYLIKSDPDYNKELRNKLGVDDSNEYKSGIIALFKKDSMDEIKYLYSDIIKNSNMISIIHKYTKNRKMIIEPLDSIDIFKCIIIPPVESLTELLSFLNEYDALYNNQYIYFEDFDATYLLGNSGKPIHSNDMYDTIIIDICDITNEKSIEPGISIDQTSKSYILHISSQDTSIDIDHTKSIEYESIVGVSSSGEIYKVSLNNGEDNILNKQLVQRVYNDNMRFIDNLRNEMNSASIFLQISKTEMDSSLFTPNKEYLVNNYKDLKNYNGKYILSYKKEILIQQDTEFMSNTILGLRKIEG